MRDSVVKMACARKCSVILLLCVAVLWSANCAQSQFSQAQKDLMLSDHNRYRAAAKACPPLKPLVWDENLAKVAQDYADTCNYRHNDAATRQVNITAGGKGFWWVGENLYITATTIQRIGTYVGHITRLWHDEINLYDIRSNQCALGQACGHYTQVVWDQTTSLGCGGKVCLNGITKNDPWQSRYPTTFIVVCNYGPGGNINGRKPFQPCPVETVPPTTSAVSTAINAVNFLAKNGTAEASVAVRLQTTQGHGLVLLCLTAVFLARLHSTIF